MKRYILFAAILLFCIFLTACGADKKDKTEENVWQGIAPGLEDLSNITERTEYSDITIESENFSLEGERGLLGAQFYQGEPVWIRAEGSDVYLYRKDGSRELLLSDIPRQYVYSGVPLEEVESGQYTQYSYQWYMDQEGNYYCYGTICEKNGQYDKNEGSLVKILSTGEIFYETAIGSDIRINDLCQTEDGRIYLLLYDITEDEGGGDWLLAEIEPTTGKLVEESVKELPFKFGVYLGKAGSYPAVAGVSQTDGRKILKVDMAEGSLSPILFFTGTSYGWHNMQLQDMQVSEDGEIELLWTGTRDKEGLWERLKTEKIDKIPIVVRGAFYGDTWLGSKAAQFNMQNSAYHVVVEDCGSGNDMEDFARLTSVQIGVGKGPDIINGILMSDYMEGLLEKGTLEELNPYMEASGIREEDYFPLTFATWRQRERIYGVNPSMVVWDEAAAEEVLRGRDVPDIETLADALLAWDGRGVYRRGYDSADVLKNFLEGTESLWGMLDWENGSCDFDTPLFGKLLEAAGRYGDDGRKNSESSITELRVYRNIVYFDGRAQQEAKGKVTSGVLFDDGCYAVSESGYALAMNANSSNKEGAWEFIRFLISEESQSTDTDALSPPVQREAFEIWMQECVKKGESDKMSYDISEKKQAEFRKGIEEARPLPIRIVPVLDIILEEAADYFSGYKSAEEISGVINRRVQLFLDERK